jgi:uncharacterized membrane protein
MQNIEQSLDVDVPVEMAYDQWARFEEFPRFMVGVQSVQRLDATLLHWTARIGEHLKEWDARITAMIPNQRIAWRSAGDDMHAGAVTFHALSPERTQVVVQFSYEPEGLIEIIGDRLGLVSRRVATDLLCFKDFVEARSRESRAPWNRLEVTQ